MAAFFATAALVLVNGPRAAVQNGSGCRANKLQGDHGRDAVRGCDGADRLDRGVGSYHIRQDKLDRVARIGRIG
jgi:hypothetical protein